MAVLNDERQVAPTLTFLAGILPVHSEAFPQQLVLGLTNFAQLLEFYPWRLRMPFVEQAV